MTICNTFVAKKGNRTDVKINFLVNLAVSPSNFSPSHRPIHSVLAGTQVRHGVLHCRIRKVGMLLCLKPKAGQAGIAGVSVHVGTGRGGIGARGCSHCH